MRVWIINPFDELPGEPGRPGRFWSLCRVLAEQGHDVTWWTADFSHRRKVRRSEGLNGLTVDALKGSEPGSAQPINPSTNNRAPGAHTAPSSSLPATRYPLLSSPRHVGATFQVRLIPVTPYQSNVGLARLRSHRVFGRNLEKALREETRAGRRPDRIVASWPPVEAGEVAVRLGREWSVPVTIDVMDAWPEAFAAFIPGPAWVARLALAPWRRRARKVFAGAERVSGVGRAFLDYARSQGANGPAHLAYLGAWFGIMECGGSTPLSTARLDAPPPGRADPLGTPSSRSASDSSDPTAPTAHPPHPLPSSRLSAPRLVGVTSSAARGAPLRLLYLGNIGRSQDLATVVAGLAMARAQGHEVELDIAGSGEREAELTEAIAAAGLGDVVRLHGFLSGAELDALVAEAHIGVNPVRGESLIACPYKVADYLAAGLPILNSLPGELAELLAEYEAGHGFTAGQPETFAAALGKWASDPALVATMSASARRLGEAWFAREKTYPALARFTIGD